MKISFSQLRRSSGEVLVEVMVGLVLSTLLLALTGSLWLVGSRDLAATGNYVAALESQSRQGIELRSRHLRLAGPETGARRSDGARSLRVPNAVVTTEIAFK